MYLLDTNVLSELMKQIPSPYVLQWLDDQKTRDLFISAITKAEIELGIALLPESRRKTALTDAANSMFLEFSNRCLAFSDTATTKYAQLVANRRKKGRPITTEDAQIAAIALTHGLTVVTRNIADFEEVSDLTVINPWKI